MFVVDEARILAMFFKFGEALFFTFMSFSIRKKNPDYILNRVFSNAFLCFVVFVLGDAIAFLIAPQNYTTYIIARVIYGVGYALLFTYAFLMLNAALIIRHSERILDNKKLLRIEVLILVIFLAVFLFNAKITILDANNNPIDPHNFPPLVDFRMTEGLTPLSMIATIIPFFYYGIAAWQLAYVIKNASDMEWRKKMINLEIGIILIPLGFIYFVIRGVFINQYDVITTIIGHLFFIISPILIYSAMAKRTQA